MSLSPSTLSAIQHAGEGLHAARQAVSGAVQAQAEKMIAIVASQPFSPESDLAYAQLRNVSRLTHELQAMEDQLRALYTSATEMMEPETPVLVALPGHAARSRAAGSSEGAQDVVAKTVPSHKSNLQEGQSDKSQLRSSNDEKVLGYLKKVLDRRSWRSLTHGAIAQGAGIPLGSVGLALRRMVAAGKVREGNKGAYRLV